MPSRGFADMNERTYLPSADDHIGATGVALRPWKELTR